MKPAGAVLRRTSFGGRSPGGAERRRRSAAAALAVAATSLLAACASTGPPRAAARAVPWNVETGLDLYGAGDFVPAAQRFGEAADEARRYRDSDLERRARAAECMAWLRAHRLGELSRCSVRLQALQLRARRSDPGVNTLLAFGAIAGRRPLPPLKVPNAVRPLVHGAAEEGQ